MDFNPIEPRRSTDNIVPMINVVFLLLIFFMITSQFLAPPPEHITPPAAMSDDTAKPDTTLYISADGVVTYLGYSNSAAIDALTFDAPDTITIEADQTTSAQVLITTINALNSIHPTIKLSVRPLGGGS